MTNHNNPKLWFYRGCYTHHNWLNEIKQDVNWPKLNIWDILINGIFPRACITELTQVIDMMLLLVAPRSSDQVDSLWPREAIWWQGSRSTLAQVMPCCLKAPSHFLNQCCVLICEVLWHSLDLVKFHRVPKLLFCILTHWGRGKMAAIFQTTFSTSFSWLKMYEFRLRFHWNLFPRVQLTIFHHWFR